MNRRRFAVALVLVGAFAGGCFGPSRPALSPIEQERAALAQRLAGTWRVTSYVPATGLGALLMKTLRAEDLVIEFANGRVRSASSSFALDRQFRLVPLANDSFQMFIVDEQGVEYESLARFDQAGRILFETKTEPWIGSGVLQRQGPAFPPR